MVAGFVGFLLVLLISTVGQISLGFEVTGNIAGDAGKQDITYKNKNGSQFSNKLDPQTIEVLPAEKVARFLDKKHKEKLIVPDISGNLNYTAWAFKIDSGKKLNNFNINNYYVCIPDRICPDVSYLNTKAPDILLGLSAMSRIPEASGGVGLYIDLTYSGTPISERLPGLQTAHWIQFVEDASQRKDGNGSVQPFIDVLDGNLTPYYGNEASPAGTGILAGTYFVDRPYMRDLSKVYAETHDWKAELYLVEETAPKIVTIYGGIRYGFHNERKNDQVSETPCNQSSSQIKLENKQNDINCKTTARSSNDPHLVTFDGLKYDLQTVGEVILIKSSHSDFEVQARQTPWNNSASVSINSAVAIKVGDDRMALYSQGLPDADTTTPLRVNGKPTTIQGEKLALTGGGEILKQGGNYVISAPTGEKVLISSSGSFLNVSPIVHNRSGKYNGLLGNVNGKPNDDLQVRGGKNVLEARSTYGDVKQVVNLVGLRLPGVLDRAEQVYFDQLYKEFANSWRVKQEESLFDYPAGKTTKSYLNPGFPDKYLTLNMLSADQIQKAQNACTEAKVTEDLMEGCIFDVGFSGFTEFARATAEISGYIGLVNQLIPGLNIPTPEQAVNVIIEKVKPKICAFGVCL